MRDKSAKEIFRGENPDSITVDITFTEQPIDPQEEVATEIPPEKVKSWAINFKIPDTPWILNDTPWLPLSSDATIVKKFVAANIPREWLTTFRSEPFERSIRVKWAALNGSLASAEREWRESDNTPETFPRKAEDLLPRIGNVIRSFLKNPQNYSIEANPPGILENSGSQFTGTGSVTLHHMSAAT